MPSPTTPVSGENEVMVGIPDGVVTVTARAADAAPVLPAASVAVAVKSEEHSTAPPSYKVQAPLLFATALPNSVAPSNTLTAALASAVPVNVSALDSGAPVADRAAVWRERGMLGATGATCRP